MTAMAILGLAVLTVLPACGTGAPQAAPAAPARSLSASAHPDGSPDAECLTPAQIRRMFYVAGPGQDQIATVSIGTGPVTVILAHQRDGSMCQWWPFALSLAARFRVIAFDFDGAGASPPGHSGYPGEVVAETRWAGQHSSGRIVLMGASMGATAVMVAAASLGSSVSGVVYLSGPAQFGAMDALAAARHVHVPVLFGYGTQDVSFAGDVRNVRAAVAAADKPLVTAINADHGVDLVSPGTGQAAIRAAVLRFIEAVAR